MLRIAIRRTGDSVAFDPQDATLSIGTDGRTFFFENYDPAPHDPEPDPATQNGFNYGQWFETPIAAGNAHRATPSIQNSLPNDAAGKPMLGKVTYTCTKTPGLT